MLQIQHTRTSLFDVAQQSYSSQGPVGRTQLGLEVDATDVGAVGAAGFPIDGTLVQPRILPSSGRDGVDVHGGHRFVQHLDDNGQQGLVDR